MKIRIMAVGKIKEPALSSLISEYEKRIQPYSQLEIIEVNDIAIPRNTSVNEENLVIEQESEKILKYIQPQDYVVALTIEGQSYDSLTFSEEMMQMLVRGQATITFLIGGSLGLSPTIKKRAQKCISFSKMTFPHQLMRLFLLEQIYRAWRIIKNEPYHK